MPPERENKLPSTRMPAGTGPVPIRCTGCASIWSGPPSTAEASCKYRRSVLQEPIASRLSALLRQACEVREWQLHELNIQPDHVHLLLQISPSDSVVDVMNLLKGGTSRLLRREFPELAEFLWGDSLWGDGYFAETVGQQEEGIVRAYIRDQNTPRSSKPPRKKPGTSRV